MFRNLWEGFGKASDWYESAGTEVVWQTLYQKCFWDRNGGPIVFGGISAFDIALWDIKAKVAGMPLYRLIGGSREKIPFYIAGGYYAKDKGIPELQKEMEEYLSWGAKAVKMKVGLLSMEEDAARVR